MSGTTRVRWGDWITERARFVGYARKQDLAADVGCRPHRISFWSQLDVPPRRMSKGFDDALARALKTTKHVLLSDYVNVSPTSPIIRWADDRDEDQVWNQPEWQKFSDAERLQVMAPRLLPAELAQLVSLAIAMKQIRINEDRKEFIEQVKQGHFQSPHFPPLPPDIASHAPKKSSGRRRHK